ncbi:HesA/MoeB/ThiF family protein [Pleionea sediminis]|uniref:HesA/MoeB/ThiF family protein n=1 Tax=Pleionea sediminis TaxID=2569479 RepID=UPI00118477C1|nr:molybdopterin-synthase adenylyltransferase MoeB [Pleionea sediminis]
MELDTKELLHYARQVILPEVDEVGQLALKRAEVAIFGIGGLGSPVSLYLAASGIGKIHLIDHDQVETSNLHRQIAHGLSSNGHSKVSSAAKRCVDLNPYIDINLIEERLENINDFSQFANCNLIIDCLDSVNSRKLLNELSIQLKIPMVSGSAIRFEGQLSVFNLNKASPCYDCVYQNIGNLDENCFDKGIMGPVVGTIGSLQAMEVIKIILNIGQPLDGKLLIYDAKNSSIQTLKVSKNKKCHCNK